MDVYHGTWLPAINTGFENQGQFIFWLERHGKLTACALKNHYCFYASYSSLPALNRPTSGSVLICCSGFSTRNSYAI